MSSTQSTNRGTVAIVNHRGQTVSVPVIDLATAIAGHAFVRFYDAAQVASDSRLAPGDWAVSTLLQAPIRRYAPLQCLLRDDAQQWRNCDQALEAIGADVPLESGEALAKCQAVQRAFEALMSPTGIGPSIASKILHKKRPQLVPVADDYVCSVLSGPSGGTRSAEAVSSVIFGAFRDQLITNTGALQDVKALLPAGFPDLSLARLFDIAIWMHADSLRHSEPANTHGKRGRGANA